MVPAPGAPIGSGTRLPIGLQIMAPAWHEASLLPLAAVLESELGAAPRPAVWYDLLPVGGTAAR